MDSKSSNDSWSDEDTNANSSKTALQRMKKLDQRVQTMRQKLKSLPKSPLGKKKKAPLGMQKRSLLGTQNKALLGTKAKAPLGIKNKAVPKQTKTATPLGKTKMADLENETRQGSMQSDGGERPSTSNKSAALSPPSPAMDQIHQEDEEHESEQSQLDIESVGTEPLSTSGAVEQYLDSQETDTEEENETDDDNEWYSQWSEQFGEVEDTGPPLPEQLASLVSGMVRNKMAADKELSLMAEVKTPSNATMLGNPRVNPDVWSNIGSHVRKQDLRLAAVGERISRMLTTTAKVTADLAELRNQVPKQNRDAIRELSKAALQGIQFGAMALRELNQRRRENIRPALNLEYQSMCNQPNAETETLFGDDVADQMKSVQHIQSIGHKMTRGGFLGRGRAKNFVSRSQKRGNYQAASYRSTPYQRPQNKNTYRGRGSRGHRRGWNN